MTTSTETDIKELKELILGLDKKIDGLDRKFDTKIDGLEKKLDLYTAKTDEKLTGISDRIVDLKQEVNKMDEKTERQDNRYFNLLVSVIGFLVSAFIAILVGLGKVLFFPNP